MQRRFMVLVAVVLLMAAMLVATMGQAFAVTGTFGFRPVSRPGPTTETAVAEGGVGVPTSACNTVAGVGGFEWRDGGTVCWLTLPGWDAF